MDYLSAKRPAQFRLPEWAHLFVEERAAAAGTTKTEIVLRALECLREREVEEAMAEGYLARASADRDFAEVAIRVSEESWPEW